MAKTFSAVAVFPFPMYTENSKMESFLQKCYWKKVSEKGLQKTESVFCGRSTENGKHFFTE